MTELQNLLFAQYQFTKIPSEKYFQALIQAMLAYQAAFIPKSKPVDWPTEL